jgi:hypothetical protein
MPRDAQLEFAANGICALVLGIEPLTPGWDAVSFFAAETRQIANWLLVIQMSNHYGFFKISLFIAVIIAVISLFAFLYNVLCWSMFYSPLDQLVFLLPYTPYPLGSRTLAGYLFIDFCLLGVNAYSYRRALRTPPIKNPRL